jgi:hypothetical protein
MVLRRIRLVSVAACAGLMASPKNGRSIGEKYLVCKAELESHSISAKEDTTGSNSTSRCARTLCRGHHTLSSITDELYWSLPLATPQESNRWVYEGPPPEIKIARRSQAHRNPPDGTIKSHQ